MIRIDDLTVRYPRMAAPALKRLSLHIRRGETVLLLGPSGGGKSTLALALGGLIPHDIFAHVQGRIEVAGLNPLAAKPGEMARQVGMVFQDPEASFATLTVEDELAFGLENLRTPAEAMPARIRAALDAVRLSGFRHRRLDTLSGGEAQRVALAALLAMDTPILVLDEPTSNLDPAGTREFFETLARLRAERTILLIEHKLDACLHLADRLVLLAGDGSLMAQGEPARTFRNHLPSILQAGIWIPEGLAPPRYGEVGSPLEPAGEPAGSDWQRSTDIAGSGLIPAARASRAWALSGTPGPARQETEAEGTPTTRPETAGVGPAVLVEDLSFAYDGGSPVLRGVELEIRQGDFLALVGANGSGKTTLGLHLMGLLSPPQRGQVTLFGEPVARLAARELTERAGFVFQNPEHQFVADTVWDELAYGMRAREWAGGQVAQRVEVLLSRFGLQSQAQQNPFTLSQGQKRRLSVATMLAVGQRLLILDEPTFGQDRRTALDLMDALARLNREEVVILIITHDMRLVRHYAKRAAVLTEGRIAFTGTPQALFDRPDLLDAARLR